MTPDQVIEAKHALAGMAEILATYYRELREQGFDKTEAMRLVVDYQRQIITGGS